MPAARSASDRLATGGHQDGECYRWRGAHTSKGYGSIAVDGSSRGVHVVAWELANGPLPHGLELDHVYERGCRHRDCYRLEHLEPVTHGENLARRRLEPRTHCLHGHEMTAENSLPQQRNGRTIIVCRACRKIYAAAYRAKVKASA